MKFTMAYKMKIYEKCSKSYFYCHFYEINDECFALSYIFSFIFLFSSFHKKKEIVILKNEIYKRWLPVIGICFLEDKNINP